MINEKTLAELLKYFAPAIVSIIGFYYITIFRLKRIEADLEKLDRKIVVLDADKNIINEKLTSIETKTELILKKLSL